jgi:phosphatidylglycerophosphatase A
MNTRTEPPSPTAESPAPAHKPSFALFIATAGGLGYIPDAPGTFGSLAGLIPAALPWWLFYGINAAMGFNFDIAPVQISHASFVVDPFFFSNLTVLVLVAAFGVWAAGRAASFWNQKDPQRVVIDEVSGQHLALLLGCALPMLGRQLPAVWTKFPLGLITVHSPLNWKYFLVGLILFRGFDIWKPFPVRQAESLPGGWGIMADDWVAGIYAGLGLWLARSLGL